jgi:hypothetical protein
VQNQLPQHAIPTTHTYPSSMYPPQQPIGSQVPPHIPVNPYKSQPVASNPAVHSYPSYTPAPGPGQPLYANQPGTYNNAPPIPAKPNTATYPPNPYTPNPYISAPPNSHYPHHGYPRPQNASQPSAYPPYQQYPPQQSQQYPPQYPPRPPSNLLD